MTTLEDREALARIVLDFADSLANEHPPTSGRSCPIKELEGAKQRLAPLSRPAQRRALIEVMMGEVLEAVAGARSLAGILVVTLDPAGNIACRALGARVVTEGARDGHTGSVTAAACGCSRAKAAAA